MELSKRAQSVSPSTTLVITAKAKEMREQGLNVIGLGAGEPDFNTPKHILDAAYESSLEGQTKYTATAGLPRLKKAIQKKLLMDQGLEYDLNQIIVCSGAKHALYTLFQVLLNDLDEVIIPSPYWVSYPEQVKLAGGVPVYVEGLEENNFKVTPDQIEPLISSRTRAIIINSPSNPTGMIYTKEELIAIGQVCLKHNILIISDEIYEKLIYGHDAHHSIAQLSPEFKRNTIIINGVSKSHSMTGWRIGYAAGNQQIISAMTALASHSTSNPTTPAQYATIAAYEQSQECVEEMRKSFAERLEILYPKLLEIPGLTCKKPQGAFYLYPNVKETAKLCGYDQVDTWVKDLLEEALVAIIPGSGFGTPDNIRLSYATSLENFEEALKRIKKFTEMKIQKQQQDSK